MYHPPHPHLHGYFFSGMTLSQGKSKPAVTWTLTQITARVRIHFVHPTTTTAARRLFGWKLYPTCLFIQTRIMPKATKSKPATHSKPSKAALPSAARAAQRERTTEYKQAKASALASTVKGKGVHYHDEDDDEGEDDGEVEGVDNDSNGDNDNCHNRSEDGKDGEDGEDEEAMDDAKPEYEPYKSKCGNFVYVPDDNGDYTKYSMIDRPEGKLNNLPKLVKMEGNENKDLIQGIRNTIRTITRHVTRNIKDCTFSMVSPEQFASITIQARKSYPILARFRQSWATREFAIRALTNGRDHQNRIQKAGGLAAWCAKLRTKREAKKTANAGKEKTNGKNCTKPDASNATNQAGGSCKVSNKARGFSRSNSFLIDINSWQTPAHESTPQNASDDEEPPVPKPSGSSRKAARRIQDSDDEGSGGEQAPSPKLRPSKTQAQKQSSKRAPPSEDDKEEDTTMPTPTSKSASPKRKAKDVEESNRPRKKARNQPPAETEDDEPMPGPKPSKGKGKEIQPAHKTAPSQEFGTTQADTEPTATRDLSAFKAKAKADALAKSKAIAVSRATAEAQMEDEETYPPASSTLDNDDVESVQNTQEYPSTIRSGTPLRPDASNQDPPSADADDSNKEATPALKPARKNPRLPSPAQADIGEPPANKGGNCKAAPANKAANNKQKANGKNMKEPPPPAKKSGLVLQPPVPTASKPSDAPLRGKKTGKGGRQAKQELVDDVDLGSLTSAKRMTRNQAKSARA
ncbi:hypothetical protein RhiXN_09481 [Rhizoctonia solani]|uniref:Uncharacterized protein n=1 Tax=Rhizoctonia solani TaxID=456999 RepID=A0A8H8SXV1_9AGAM|nr:uncharacterized protein RhiXN_09481 [Rhizoctonia solani]QRW21894.1 hypothetical protein RhiXN_09481 [Rhizoctonia solani]